jgi:hypothetical protein
MSVLMTVAAPSPGPDAVGVAPLTGLPGLSPILLAPILALTAALLLALWWITRSNRSGMAARTHVRATLGVPAMRRGSDELRPSLGRSTCAAPKGQR